MVSPKRGEQRAILIGQGEFERLKTAADGQALAI